MNQILNSLWHFPIMILASLILFFIIIRLVLGEREFVEKKRQVLILAFVVIIAGMIFGKYGANWGLPWWIYYPVPMLLNVLLPPFILKLNIKKTFLYITLSFSSAPIIHLFFSSFGWIEYMPFWTVF